MTTLTPRPDLVRRLVLRTFAVVVLASVLLLLSVHLAYAQPAPTPAPAPAPGPANPFDGVNPDLGLLGPALNSTWKRALAALWGASIAVAGVYVLTSFLKLKKARGRGMASDLSDASDDLKLSLYALAGVAAVSPIIGGVLFLVQPAA